MSICPHCPGALARHQATGLVIICDCGTVHAPEGWRWPSEHARIPATKNGVMPVACERVGATTDCAHVAPTKAPEVRPIEDPEEVRVRRLLCELRPDRGGPCGWGPYENAPAAEDARPRPPMPRAESGGGGIPAGAFLAPLRGPGVQVEAVTLRLRRIAVDDPLAGAALRWLQRAGTLSRGLGALYGDLGAATATAEERARWTTARQHVEGARAVGRARVTRAGDLWWGLVVVGLCPACFDGLTERGEPCAVCRGTGRVERRTERAA